MTRARDLGVPFGGEPGPLNAITDVPGVAVGHRTLISGSGPRRLGEGPVRTGVTAILPRGATHDPVYAGWYALNGNGEMTGTTWIEESGFLETPVVLTNTHSVGVARDAVVRWYVREGLIGDGRDLLFGLPVAAETFDGRLNDIDGFHVTAEDVIRTLDAAEPGPVAEGNVGGGTGMICHGFKGGIGTASRRVPIGTETYSLGVLVQANYGAFEDLTIAGVPLAAEIPAPPRPDPAPRSGAPGDGSIIVVIASDAPLLPHQLKRLCRRAPMGIARTGGIASNGSGDIFVAFSTANPGLAKAEAPAAAETLPNNLMDGLFRATIQATEEAIVNAMVAAEDMTGADDVTVVALPHAALRAALGRYNRLTGT